MKGFWRKKIVLIGMVIVLIAAASSYFYFKKSKPTVASSATDSVTTVRKGEILNTVSGSSQFEAKELQIISAPMEATIKTMNLTRSKTIKKGDLLIELSEPDVDINLQKGLVTYKQLQFDYADLNSQLNALTIRAPISGKLTYAPNIDIASQISKTTRIATISDTSTLTVTLPFLLENAVQMHPGDSIDLSIDSFMLTKSATIQKISKSPKADANGNKTLDVDINVVNDGTLDAGLLVSGSATINGQTALTQAKAALQYVNMVTVLSNTTGTIAKLNFKSGDMVKQGDMISSVSNDALSNDIANKKAAIDQQQVTNDGLQEKVNSLKIVAPFDGVFSTDFVNQKTNILNSYPVGAKVLSGAQFGGVANLATMQIPIAVDELDLPSIKVGQTATIKVDSLTGKSFTGQVNQVSTVGTTSNGVSTYTVVISVANPDQLLKYGMTATAEIVIEDKKNVLVIPVEAMLTRQGKHYVSLKNADGTVTPKEIKIGVNSKTQVEVTDGLKAGDSIVSTASATRQRQNLSQAQIDALRKQFQQNGGAGAGGPGGNGGGGFGGGGNGGRNGG